MKETKLMRVYVEDEWRLIELRRELTREMSEQASYADVIRCLIELRVERSYPLLCKYRSLEELRIAE